MTGEITASPTATSAAGHVSQGDLPPYSRRYRGYVLAMILLTFTLAYLDRQIISILAEPIKRDLQISDTKLGLLTGLAFALVYCGLGLPVARLADRFNRVWILSGSMLLWSACTALCSRAVSFPYLVAARIGVGVGEAGVSPTCMALITDYVPREKRATALSIFAMGAPIGALIGMASGGLIAQHYGWRTAFLLAGLPGIFLSAVLFLTIREPRERLPKAALAATETYTFLQALSYLSGRKSFWGMAAGAGVCAFVSFGQTPFLASFFLRVHEAQLTVVAAKFGMEPLGFIGVCMGLISGVFGVLSNWTGGMLADRLATRDPRYFGIIPAVSTVIPIPFFCMSMLVKSPVAALLLLLPSYILGGLWFGPVLTTIQSVVPSNMRATASSIALFILNIIGLAFGALFVGMMSDWFNSGLGLGPAEGVRWALIASAPIALIGAGLFFFAGRHVGAELVD